MVRFLDQETAEILQFLDPEIVKMDKNFGSRNHRNDVISGSRNRRKGRQILYRFFGFSKKEESNKKTYFAKVDGKDCSLSTPRRTFCVPWQPFLTQNHYLFMNFDIIIKYPYLTHLPAVHC